MAVFPQLPLKAGALFFDRHTYPDQVCSISTSGSTTRANAFGRIGDYFDRVEGETAIILQVETAAALSRSEDIAAVDGVGGIFFGPADIGADIGHLGKPMAPPVWDTIMPVARRLMDAGVPVGTLAADPHFAARLLRDGFTFVAAGSDAGLLARGADNLLATVKNAVD